MNRIRLLVLLGIFFAPVPVAAQEPDSSEFAFDRVVVDSSRAPSALCYLGPRYIVVEIQRPERVGADFFIERGTAVGAMRTVCRPTTCCATNGRRISRR